MSPSHHSSSSHSSHSSSHSHHSSSRSHSSSSRSRSHHSSSSHSSSFLGMGSLFSRNTTPVYRNRTNQPKNYSGVTPKIYRCKYHDYVHYNEPWTDELTGVEYKAGYYDEDGNFYEDVVFSKQGVVSDSTTAVCKCDYCGMEDSRPWPDREKPCIHCGGTMHLVSQIDALVDDENDSSDSYSYDDSYSRGKSSASSAIYLLIVGMLFFSLFSGIIDTYHENQRETYYSPSSFQSNSFDSKDYSDNYSDSYSNSYNIPTLGDYMFLKEEGKGFVLTDEADYKDNFENGGYKHLSLDSDGNYYDASTDMYVWLNQDIDPPQFQYWLEGLSSEYGDYGWMEYDSIEECWYIETSNENWEKLDDATYEEFQDRLWHIEYEF